MSEHLDEQPHEDGWAPQPPPEPTGHAGVDAVLVSLGGLDDLPVSAHVAVFEDAHRSLRDALSGATASRSGPLPGPPRG